jgi:hypothetical protein
LHQVGHIGSRSGRARIVRPVEHVGDDQRGQHADDHQHHHEFDEREAAGDQP